LRHSMGPSGVLNFRFVVPLRRVVVRLKMSRLRLTHRFLGSAASVHARLEASRAQRVVDRSRTERAQLRAVLRVVSRLASLGRIAVGIALMRRTCVEFGT